MSQNLWKEVITGNLLINYFYFNKVSIMSVKFYGGRSGRNVEVNLGHPRMLGKLQDYKNGSIFPEYYLLALNMNKGHGSRWQ